METHRIGKPFTIENTNIIKNEKTLIQLKPDKFQALKHAMQNQHCKPQKYLALKLTTTYI